MGKPKNKKRQFFSYSEESMHRAVEAVSTGIMSKKKAAAEFNVPRSTLVRKVSGKGPLKRKMGPTTELSENEEQSLVDWIIAMARNGFPVHKNNFIQSVRKYIIESGKNVRFLNVDSKTPGRAWFEGFLKRHPEVKEKHVESVSKARAAVTMDRLQDWFGEIETYFKAEGLEDILADPSRIFNADEAGFALCPKIGKVLRPTKIQEDFYIRVSAEKEQITVMGTFSADGICVPPMLIFPYKKMPKVIVESVPGDWGLGRSESGWMNSEVFFEFISNHLLRYVKSNNITRPVVLFVDGHRSHLTQHVSKFCDENGIILISLFPNSTHIIQPADVSVFRPLKAGWKSAVRDWKFHNFPKDVTRHTFGSILKDVFEKFAQAKTIQNGFRKTGLFPFDKNNVDYSKCMPNRRIGRNADQESDNLLASSKFAQKVLDVVESKIPKVTLVEFSEVYKKKSKWEGNIESANLYQVWSALKDDFSKCQVPITAEDDILMSKRDSERAAQTQIDNQDDSSQPSTTVSAVSILGEDVRHRTPSPPYPSTSSEAVHNSSFVWRSPARPEVNDYSKKENEGYKVPTPFKACLPYPKTPEKEPPKRKRTVFPFVVSSEKYRDFYQNEKLKKLTPKTRKKNKIPRADTSSDSDINPECAEKTPVDGNRYAKDKKVFPKTQKKKVLKENSSSDSDLDVNITYAEDEDDMDPMSDIEDIQITEGKYVIVEYENKYYPGIVLKRDHDGAEVKTMVTAGMEAWKWPFKEDVLYYFNEHIKCQINQLTVKNSRGH